jgi:hypothetical protein
VIFSADLDSDGGEIALSDGRPLPRRNRRRCCRAGRTRAAPIHSIPEIEGGDTADS